MKTQKSFAAIAAMLVIAFLTAAPATAQNAPRTNTVTVQMPLPPKLVDYLKASTKDVAGVVISGGLYKIPVGIAATYIEGKAHKHFGKWLAQLQICHHFGLMWAGCQAPQSGIINVEIVVDQGPPEVRIVVPFFAHLDKMNGGKPEGYVAPMNANGTPTMKYDVFGDGTLVLERMDCPKRRK